ncbi:(2Fe-2S)-binding protein [Bacillaceae bacterium Marseille-Q3522]|nr:(2Fe-2S)-binding protein [Bacillaceae bacterium Marseille-Q3522]
MAEGKAVETVSRANWIDLSFELNGKLTECKVSPVQRFVDLLRDDLQLTGTKIACGIGRCGACSVMMNGRLVNACLLMAYQVQGASVTTIEGIGTDAELDPVQQAFLQTGGFQCGYCTPGMIIAVKALLEECPHPEEAEMKEALAGNLCRCTGYSGIIRAVQKVSVKR